LENLINDSLRDFSTMPAISLWQLLFSLCTSAALCTLLAKVYIFTHSGHSYSRSYVHTQVFVGITIAVIMLIIGSNIARAFALVGALSIIRFRNPVKDSRDVAFIFTSMAIGMAAGTGFYLYALIFTMFFSFLALAFHRYRFGESSVAFYVIRIRMAATLRDQLESKLAETCTTFSIISVDRMAGQNAFDDFIYEINLRDNQKYEDVVRQLSDISESVSVTLLVGESSVNV
jgi:uncharacterized membrane protein YhiD involved in acid resistance